VKDATRTVGFIVAWPSLASFGSFRYVVNIRRVSCALNPAALRWGVGLISGITMTSVGRVSKIVSTRYVVARARSRRKAGRLSWRRRVSPSREAYQLRPRTTLDNLPIVSPVPLFAVQYDNTNASSHPPHSSVLVDGRWTNLEANCLLPIVSDSQRSLSGVTSRTGVDWI